MFFTNMCQQLWDFRGVNHTINKTQVAIIMVYLGFIRFIAVNESAQSFLTLLNRLI